MQSLKYSGGGLDSLSRIRAIAVDGGPERGPTQERTLDTVALFLEERNFRCHWRSRAGRECALFVRNDVPHALD